LLEDDEDSFREFLFDVLLVLEDLELFELEEELCVEED
jgi:hypothetical protein